MKKKLDCVLLIDDDEMTNTLNKKFIEKSGITDRIQIAWTAQEALDYLIVAADDDGKKSPQPQLIFLDINMPGMNGWDFVEKYGKLEKVQQSGIVIVMLTTSLNPDDQKLALQSPVISGFRNKPMTQQMLMEIVREYFVDSF